MINYINVGPHGTFIPSKKLKTTPKEVDDFFNELKSKKSQKLAIHFHGGLVNESSGYQTSNMMYNVYKKADAVPLTFIWETGILETLKDNFTTVHNTKFFKFILVKLLKVIGDKIGLNIKGAKGKNYLSDEQILEELSKNDPFDNFVHNRDSRGPGIITEKSFNEATIEEDLKMEFRNLLDKDDFLNLIPTVEEDETDFLIEDEESFETNSKGAKGIISIGMAIKLAKIAACVIKRFFKKRFHGVYPTIIEEIIRVYYVGQFGAFLWKGMKDKAEEMWKNNEGLNGVNQHAGRYFLLALSKYKQQNPNLEISLIGHSAGSIAICHMLKTNSKLNTPIKFKNIFFLAPACTTKLFHTEVFSRQKMFENFRMFTMSDDFEKRDHLVPYIYTRSLLYLVSGSFEIPNKCTNESILGLERNLHGTKPYNQDYEKVVANYLKQKKCVVLSKTNTNAVPGERTESEKHGDFDNDLETQKSLIHLIED